MDKFTPGPWKVYNAYDIMGQPGLIAAARIGAVTDEGIETVVKASRYGYDEINMTEADALLIATAPDLLAACEAEEEATRLGVVYSAARSAIMRIERLSPEDRQGLRDARRAWEEAIRNAMGLRRAAIAKARGEAEK